MEVSGRNDRAGRLVRAEKVRVDFIDRIPVAHVRNVNMAHDNVFGAEAGCRENAPDVRKRLLRLFPDPAFCDLPGLRIDRELPRNIQHPAGDDTRRIMAAPGC